ncbi:40S ribosomal protein S4 [Zea mays]|uniref:40S ribosomal protein S4 n=1 Tax=Zea mays TaxID=4577 RepID=A0A3L6EXY2_MAIZE|nr:40S ribosomal protein S4 [Zea mays]
MLWSHLLLQVQALQGEVCSVCQKGIPYLNTYDGRTIRYPDPFIKANDTIKIDLETNKIMDFFKFDVSNVVMVTGGRNTGRVGVIKNWEKHKGSFEVIDVLLGAFCMLCLVFLLFVVQENIEWNSNLVVAKVWRLEFI